MKMIFKLPFPPSLNRIYRKVGTRIYLTNEGKKYKSDAKLLIQNAMRKNGWQTLTDHVATTTIFFCPDKRRRDEDNLHKLYRDALTKGGAYKDDSQISASLNFKLIEKENPHMVIIVEPITFKEVLLRAEMSQQINFFTTQGEYV